MQAAIVSSMVAASLKFYPPLEKEDVPEKATSEAHCEKGQKDDSLFIMMNSDLFVVGFNFLIDDIS